MSRNSFTAFIATLSIPVFMTGMLFASSGALPPPFMGEPEGVLPLEVPSPSFSSGFQTQRFFDAAYANIDESQHVDASSALVAHHLLVASDIARVFSLLGDDETKTVVLVSPNHFSVGMKPAQISMGTWQTPYGTVESDVASVNLLTDKLDWLSHEELAFENEHGIAALTPFVARSFPNAKIVSIVLDESLSADKARELGAVIAAELPDAVLFASVDMSHVMTAEATAANDAEVIRLLDSRGLIGGVPFEKQFPIDSNASLRALFAFNQSRQTTAWTLTHHGSSLAMGATNDWHENTSHILGYFTLAP